MRLDLLRVNILAVAENDYIFAAPGYEEIAASVEIAEIASVKPAIFQNFGGGVGTVVVALHHDGTANQDFARAVLSVFRFGNPDLSTRQRLADRTEQVLSGRRQRRSAGSFGKAEGLEDIEAHVFEVASYFGIEARTAGDEVPHLRTEPAMRF